jgi:hypothetical protein
MFMWRKYLSNSCAFSASHKQIDSALWADMIHIKDIYASYKKIFISVAGKWLCEMEKELISG